MSGLGSAFGAVGRGRADVRGGEGEEGVGRTCGVCFSAFVPLVSCSSVVASAVFCSSVSASAVCSLGSFCGQGAYTHRRTSSLARGQYLLLHSLCFHEG